MGWWYRGIPENVRKSCVVRQEEDLEPIPEPYCYTDLLDLWGILDKQWAVLRKILPNKLTSKKQELKSEMIHLNTIRKNEMHPVRGIVPSEDDFEFVYDSKEKLIESE